MYLLISCQFHFHQCIQISDIRIIDDGRNKNVPFHLNDAPKILDAILFGRQFQRTKYLQLYTKRNR